MQRQSAGPELPAVRRRKKSRVKYMELEFPRMQTQATTVSDT